MLQIAEIAEVFQNAVGDDGEMDAYELMNLLNETGFISGDLCYLIHDRVLLVTVCSDFLYRVLIFVFV